MPNPIHIHEWATLSEKERARLLRRAEDDLTPFLEAVRPVIAAVASEGDDALRRYARQFDQAALLAIKVAPEEIAKAPAALSREMVAALEYGIANIRTFHERQKPEAEWWMETRPGLWAGERWVPIDDVACYVPRGKGSFPSVAMMALIPAVVAGVARIGLFTPPGSDGKADQATLAVAALLGIENVYLCGGALAVAAAAHGTETVPRFAKIVGPGSPYFMAAKKLLADRIDPGIPAGPTEALVVADETADAALVAVDLLIEAEHG
ncbi:MAG TPA: histidinol dehydrogenase, partial [Dongiaceae bacterium]|nr:histidinol dehydrogenase [Dongiaceae bacterium]